MKMRKFGKNVKKIIVFRRRFSLPFFVFPTKHMAILKEKTCDSVPLPISFKHFFFYLKIMQNYENL